MKIAFCLAGIIGGTLGKNGYGEEVDFIKCYESFRSVIFDRYDTDVFIHTWSVQQKDKIHEIYQPKIAIYEPQIQFNTDIPYKNEKFRSCSRWYSTKQVLNQQERYSRAMDINYDFIMITRFDLIWLSTINFEEMEKGCFYVANWNLHPKSLTKKENASFPDGKLKRYSDMWFIGSQEQMNYLAGTYDVIEEIGNIEYNPHELAFDRMYPKYKDSIKFMFYNSFDFALYRKHITGDYR